MATGLLYTLQLFCPISGTQSYATFLDARYPGYLPLLKEATLTFALPDFQNQSPGVRKGSVSFNTVNKQRTGAMLPAQILTAEPLLGIPALLLCVDPDAGTTLRTLYGVITSFSDDLTTLEIDGEDPSLFQETQIPTLRAIELFPSLETTTSNRIDMPPVVVLGTPARKIELPCAVATFLNCSFTLAGSAPFYRYVGLTHIPDYVVQAGDRLVYDVHWSANNACISLDLQCTDATRLQDTAAVDQNGLSTHPTNILNAYTPAKPYYRRDIDLTPIVGKTVQNYLIECQPTTSGTKTGRIANARILDVVGNTKVYIVDEVLPSITTAVDLNSNAGNTSTLTVSRTWDFGPIRANAAGVMTAPNAYRDEGRLVGSSEYTLITDVGFKFVRFTTDQRDGTGKRMRIWADLSSTEFDNNPITAAKFFLTDAVGYGLGLPADAGSFAAAAAGMNILGLNTLVGAIDFRAAGQKILGDLLWQGSFFDRQSDGDYTVNVDSASLHPSASATLYEGYQDSASGHLQSNCETKGKQYVQRSIKTQVKTVRVLAYSDPGFQQKSSLISAERTRAVSGATIELPFDYVGTGTAADKICDYEFKRRVNLDQLVPVDVGMVAKDFQLGQLVTLYAPNREINGTQYEIRQIAVRELTHTLLLAGYSDPFTYTAGTVRVQPAALVLRDYTFTTPDQPTAVGGVTYTPRVATGGASQGKAEVKASITATAASNNATHLVFECYTAGTADIVAYVEKPVSSVTTLTRSAGFLVEPGLNYDFICYARNIFNNPDRRDSAPIAPANWTNQTATGDATAPSTTLTLTMTGAFKSVKCEWTIETVRDLAYYQLQIARNNAFTNELQDMRVHATNKTISGLANDTQYFGRVRAVDRSGNAPALWSNQPTGYTSATTTRVNLNDRGDGTATDASGGLPNSNLAGHPWSDADINNLAFNKLTGVAINAGTIVTGILYVRPSTGATAIRVENGGKLQMVSLVGGTGVIEFLHSDGVTLGARLAGGSGNDFVFVPGSTNTKLLKIGDPSYAYWNYVQLYAGSGGLSLVSTNRVLIDGRATFTQISPQAGPIATPIVAKLQVWDLSGTVYTVECHS